MEKYPFSRKGPAFLAGLVFLCTAAGCTARLDITTTASDTRLVIYGTVTDEHAYHTVTVSASDGFFSGETSKSLSGAVLTLRAGGRIYDYVEVKEYGYYITSEPLAGVEGQEYVLTVEVDLDGDGMPEIFRASSVMPPAVSIDSITIRKSTSVTDRYEVLFWGEVPYDKGYYLSFSVARDRSPFTDSLSKYRIMEDRYFGSGYIEGLPCFFLSQESGESLMDGDVVGMKVDVMPGEYGKFLTDAQSELTGSIPLFSGPPANVETNIRQVSGSQVGGPLGFFGTIASRTAYTYYRKDDGSSAGYDNKQTTDLIN